MTEPVLHYIHCKDQEGGHRLAWWQWGSTQAAHLLLCIHGLTRSGRDFDTLARACLRRAHGLGRTIRIICPDIAGRGRSQWLERPADYDFHTYVADMGQLLQQLHAAHPIGRLDWLGTSMGGVMGIIATGEPDSGLPTGVDSLVLNDVGPTLEWAALQRMQDDVGHESNFPSFAAAVRYLRDQSPGFGPLSDEQWNQLSEPLVRKVAAGRWQLRYDPAIAEAMADLDAGKVEEGAELLWQLYDRIMVPTLLLRGAESDLLSAATASAMSTRGPHARVIEFDGVGHAPMLVSGDQIAPVLDFLLPDQPATGDHTP